MTIMHVYVLRVFTDEAGAHGNPLGVILDTATLDDSERQQIAARLGFSETVFVDDPAQARLRIFTPTRELPLAGHPLVGTSWLLSKLAGAPISLLQPAKAAPVATWQSDGVTWIRARVADAPDWGFIQLEAPAEIDALAVPPAPEYVHHVFWAWQDEAAGTVRARAFAGASGIAEDEATGSAALVLVDRLARPLTIRQGHGSMIYARPALDGYTEVGGRVTEDKAIEGMELS